MGISGIKPTTPESNSTLKSNSYKIYIEIILPNRDLGVKILIFYDKNRDRTIAGNSRLHSIWVPSLRGKAVVSLKRTTCDPTEINCRKCQNNGEKRNLSKNVMV